MSNRTEWTIKQAALWTAEHVSGEILVARNRTDLMSKINAFDAARRAA